ncbi:MAG: aldehyde dehydrogenase family protein [Actinomycetota bacterium]|nr:aldehyde dehydrogenase family protein [Actinomycetota bacterium]
MQSHDELYIDGAWVASSGGEPIDVIGAATEEVIGRAPVASPSDVDRAVRAARAAQSGWSSTTVSERARTLALLQEGLTARMSEIATLVAQEVGMPLPMAMLIQAGAAAFVMGSYVDIVQRFRFEQEVGNSVVVREPVGVVGAITPWNYPLYQLVCKVAPALAAGCTIVAKPSEVAPLSTFILADIVHEAGVPPGVFNLVTGDGVITGNALATHADVDMISFTGSTAAGEAIARQIAGSLKRVTLELGGKSASIILDDADLEEAVRSSASQCYLNSGQTCIAWSRLLVPVHRHDEAVSFARKVAEGFTLGDPLDANTDLGPLASDAQRRRVTDYIRTGIDEGATLVTGGAEQPDGLARGYFVKPTVFADVRPEMTIAREEIFGPVLSIIPYRDEAEAVAIANDSPYGLHGAVFSADQERATRLARQLRTGQVDINGGGFNFSAPFGGYKRSGLGRELGEKGLEEYLEVKSLQF